MSWKEWDQGEVVEAGDFQTYIQNQVVQRYANASERTTVLGTAVEEGMVSYREDANVVEVYDGSSWVDFTGDITQITAGTALTGGGTAGDVTLDVDISALATAQAGTALTASGETLNVDETELFTGGTAGYTALSNGTAGLSYQPVSHNYIINGAFDIAQRGTSVPITNNTYTLDRIKSSVNATPTTANVVQRELSPDEINAIGYGDIRYCASAQFTTVGSLTRFDFRNIIEDVRTLAGQEVTVSFWAKGTTARSGIYVFIQDFGTSGSSDVVQTPSFTWPTTWTRVTKTFTLGSMSGKTINAGNFLTIGVRVNSPADGETFEITGIQLEAGSIATPFKRHAPSLQGELAACQRYYYRIGEGDSGALGVGVARSTTLGRIFISFPVKMRKAPTALEQSGDQNDYVLFWASSAFLNSIPTFADADEYGATIDATVASGLSTNSGLILRGGTDGFLGWSAEL